MTVFGDRLFRKTILSTSDGKNKITCTIKDQSGRYLGDLLRNDSKGFCGGRLVSPASTPEWLVPGTVLYGEIDGQKFIFTLEPSIQSRIIGLSKILGESVRFSYYQVSEFTDGNDSKSGIQKF